MKPKKFSWFRLYAVIAKEFIQMKRDRATLAIMIGIPLMQVILFGFAINTDPKHLPTAIIAADDSQFVRTFIQGMKNTAYFNIVKRVNSEAAAEKMLAKGEVTFVLNIPPDFSRELVRDEHPNLLLEADGTDPAAIGPAVAAFRNLTNSVFQYDIAGQLNYLKNTPAIVNLVVQPKYNPAGITQYNIVTGLLGVVLTMAMTMTTAIAITRERDRGTMESLLATPVHPLEVLLGKILPYVIVGYIQIAIIMLIGKILFSIPTLGNVLLLFLLSFPFIAANLAVGITISTIARNPLQAVQMSVFFFLPSILLSGFMFPFRGMPNWAQWVGKILPLTHYLQIVRGILVKGNGFYLVWTQVIAILIFFTLVIILGMTQFRRTLD